MRKNPMTMRGLIDRCWLFTYNTPVEEARCLLPPQLEPITHRGKAFWNIVVSHIQAMRPWFVPLPVGVSYWHAGYRIYVRIQPEEGEPVEGLYFLRSDCSSPLMSFAGNLLTDFNFHAAGIHLMASSSGITLRIESPDGSAQARVGIHPPDVLSAGSVFDTLQEAASFLKYKPYRISINKDATANVVRIVRQEDAWRSHLLRVEEAQWAFFEGRSVTPEICYQVDPISYQWNRGQIVRVRS